MIEMRLDGASRVVKLLESLPAEIVSKRGGPVRRALREAAKVIMRNERINLQRVIAETQAETGMSESIGLMLKSLMVTRGKPPLDGKGERYLVRFKTNIYPRSSAEKVSTLKSAQLLEWGREGQRPRPFIRLAYVQGQNEAKRVFDDHMRRSLDQIIAKLKRG